MTPASTANVDPEEIRKFDAVAADWWNPDGDFRPLHDLNPVRLAFVQSHAELDGTSVLDVGCGGGLLSEAMARAGADVTGIDLSEVAIATATAHASEHDLMIDYQLKTVEDMAQSHSRDFDLVTCMEMLEHVPEPTETIGACADCLSPGGTLVLSTLNRTLKSFALGIVAAEYVMRLLPRGTHRYEQFIRPSEMARWARGFGLEIIDCKGLHYDPLRRTASLTDDVAVNYTMAFRKKR